MKKLLLSLLLVANSALADVNIFGYASQTAVKTDGVTLGGSSGKWSFAKNEVNLFGDLSVNSIQTNIRFAVGTTDEPGLEDNKLIVKYFLADKQWRLNDDLIGIRLGRVPHSLGFYNSTRNVPTVGQFIYLPEGIYREQFKWLAMSGDGGQLYWYHQFTPKFDIEVTGTWTKANLMANREVISGHFNNPQVGTFNPDKSEVRGLTIESRYTTHKFYYNWINLYFWLKPDFPYSLAIPEGRADTNVHVLGVKKYFDKFDVGIEYLQVETRDKVWDSVRASTAKYGQPTGWVFSGTYHVNEKLDVSAYHSEYYTAIGDKSGQNQSAAAALSGQNLPPEWFYVKSNSVAAKYKINDSWTLRFQYAQGHGLEPFMKSINTTSKEKWSYAAAQAIFSF